jgi:hypothetical protein
LRKSSNIYNLKMRRFAEGRDFRVSVKLIMNFC